MATKKQYWLMKSEPSVYSIDHLEKDKKTYWDGVRNFKARNYMQEMNVGDGVFFYHSNANPKAIVGIARVCKQAYPDHTQFDKKSKYYESVSKPIPTTPSSIRRANTMKLEQKKKIRFGTWSTSSL
jgi:predicted RNA-binding protein with PUA-like domain